MRIYEPKAVWPTAKISTKLGTFQIPHQIAEIFDEDVWARFRNCRPGAQPQQHGALARSFAQRRKNQNGHAQCAYCVPMYTCTRCENSMRVCFLWHDTFIRNVYVKQIVPLPLSALYVCSMWHVIGARNEDSRTHSDIYAYTQAAVTVAASHEHIQSTFGVTCSLLTRTKHRKAR